MAKTESLMVVSDPPAGPDTAITITVGENYRTNRLVAFDGREVWQHTLDAVVAFLTEEMAKR